MASIRCVPVPAAAQTGCSHRGRKLVVKLQQSLHLIFERRERMRHAITPAVLALQPAEIYRYPDRQ